MSAERDLLASAAALVVDDGMEYAEAKRRAARSLGHRGPLPSNDLLEAAVREHIAVFHAERQPIELRALRELARHWMRRLSAFRPHLSGAVWRGTATARSAVVLDLYCDDPKVAEIELLNQGLDFDVAAGQAPGRGRGGAVEALSLTVPCPALGLHVPLVLWVRDLDDQRGALRPDAGGATWRGDLAALDRLLAAEST